MKKVKRGFNTSATAISLVSSCDYSLKHQKEKVVRMYDAKIFFPLGYPPDQAQHPSKTSFTEERCYWEAMYVVHAFCTMKEGLSFCWFKIL